MVGNFRTGKKKTHPLMHYGTGQDGKLPGTRQEDKGDQDTG